MKILLFSLLLISCLYPSWTINCVAPGAFRQERDPTCKNYYTCQLVLGMYYIKTDYTCGSLQRFNPTTQTCDFTSICIDSFCDNQLPLATIPDPNADSTCRTTYIQCVGIINQYPTIERCTSVSGCC